MTDDHDYTAAGPGKPPRRRLWLLGVVLLALVLAPAPLLPPHGLAEAIKNSTGSHWRLAYAAATFGLLGIFYGTLGMLTAIGWGRATTPRGRIAQIVFLPAAVIIVGFTIRTLKLGFFPIATVWFVPVVACIVGAWFGLAVLHRHFWRSVVVMAVVGGLALWGLFGGVNSGLADATKHQLKLLAELSASPLKGDERLGLLVETAFNTARLQSISGDAVLQNRAATLALGIVVGHPRLARSAGLDDPALVERATKARGNASFRGRSDWANHYFVSAGLVVLENSFYSDSAGIVKEFLDSDVDGGGSGFSFADLLADRAGVRFAHVATRDEARGLLLQGRIDQGFVTEDFFPPAADLPEGLTTAEFRAQYGGTGAPPFRKVVQEIDRRISLCPGLNSYK